ncbi:MAG: hypothetical protein V7638_1826 [Acidobacteriota bacterium]|jgi:hypothetical protein
MARPYREVTKPLSIRMLELIQALQLVADSIQQIRRGHMRHLVTLSGQLRALLAERSKHAKPLLLDIARDFQEELRVYCMPGTDDPAFPAHLRSDISLHVAGFPITSQRQFAAQVEKTFSELLEHKILFFNGNTYTAKTVIEWYANKAGGAHYSTRIPEDFAALLMQNPFNLQPLATILKQMGDAVLLAGHQLLKKLVNLEIHVIVIVPHQTTETIAEVNYLVDWQYEGSSMRLSLTLNKRLMPSFFASGLQGTWAKVESDRLVDWSVPRHLHAALIIEEDLSTTLELAIDGVRVGRLRIEEPLFVFSDPLDYEAYHNKSVEGAPQEFSFGLAHLSMHGAELSSLDAARMFTYINSQITDDLALVLYSPKSFGHAPRGTKDYEMTGTVRKFRVRDVLKNSE